MMQQSVPEIILASASRGRQQLLADAGLQFRVVPSGVDEQPYKQQAEAEQWSISRIAETLAAEKALAVSQYYPDAVVIGADQVLECAGKRYDKPASHAEARTMLLELQGHEQRLHTAVAIAEAGVLRWQYSEQPVLIMRTFSAAFVDAYLEAMGVDALTCVAACAIEREGIHLLSEMHGAHSTIIGLPLLPILAWLRQRGVILS